MEQNVEGDGHPRSGTSIVQAISRAPPVNHLWISRSAKLVGRSIQYTMIRTFTSNDRTIERDSQPHCFLYVALRFALFLYLICVLLG